MNTKNQNKANSIFLNPCIPESLYSCFPPNEPKSKVAQASVLDVKSPPPAGGFLTFALCLLLFYLLTKRSQIALYFAVSRLQ